MLAFADLAMYEAKEAGRNRFSRLTRVEVVGSACRPSRRGGADPPRARRGPLLAGLPADPRLASNEVHQYELLLRLQDERGESRSLPGAFLDAAERFGLIQAIDAWVVRQAVALIAEHARAGRRLVLDVNLSGKSIGDPEFARSIEEHRHRGLDRSRRAWSSS